MNIGCNHIQSKYRSEMHYLSLNSRKSVLEFYSLYVPATPFAFYLQLQPFSSLPIVITSQDFTSAFRKDVNILGYCSSLLARVFVKEAPRFKFIFLILLKLGCSSKRYCDTVIKIMSTRRLGRMKKPTQTDPSSTGQLLMRRPLTAELVFSGE